MKKSTFAVNALAIAFSAMFINQVGHESAHGILAALGGANWTQLNLFFAEHVWPGETSRLGEAISVGGAAIFNIMIAILCANLFNKPALASRGTLRLFLFYLAIYNAFAGFGYLFVDPIFYQPGGENLGDWKKIVDMLGGGWAVRVPISLIGAAGVLWVFLWIGRNAHAFLPVEKPARLQYALLLLLLPYIIFSTLFTFLAYTGPIPREAFPFIAISYWFGDFGVGWGAFMAGMWMQPPAGFERSVLPNSIEWGWVATSFVLFAIAVFILLPTLQFA